MMRRLFCGLAIAWLGLSEPLGAVGTITQTTALVGNIRKITFTCTADASDGSFPSTAVTLKFEGRLLKLVTDPGATAPTDNYDIALTDQYGSDVLQGLGANRDTANAEVAPIVLATTVIHPVSDESDTLTLGITNNIVNSATVVIVLYFALGG